MDAIATLQLEGFTLNILPDDDPESPRDWDNLGTMVCFHPRYSLGDKHDFGSPMEFTAYLERNKDSVIALPLYLYDHSGISIATSIQRGWYHAAWDSGLVGYIYVDYATLRKEYGWQRITQARRDKIIAYLDGEVQTYDQYLTGDIYGYDAVCNACGESIDSGWGFYGDDPATNGMQMYLKGLTCSCQDGIGL